MSAVSTLKVVDKRIEPQPAPVYATTVGPVQNQFYSIPASGLSNSYITFNNLTTLGADRAYLDTFELEITAEIHLTRSMDYWGRVYTSGWEDNKERADLTPYSRWTWTFESFPFNKVCEECRVNVNGGAFFSSPLSYLRAKERYWDQDAIQKAYGGVCPCNKAIGQNEVGIRYDNPFRINPRPVIQASAGDGTPVTINEGDWSAKKAIVYIPHTGAVPSRLTQQGFDYSSSGVNSNPNNWMVPNISAQGRDTDPLTQTVRVTWREPIFASPFSSRIDATYGRPLYNITSLDIAFNLQDLRNMILVANPFIASYSVDIVSANLCYQVETVPRNIAPPMTVVPYRRFVPYITDAPESITENRVLHLKSGVYTLNEVPQAIWIFAGPQKSMLQSYSADTYTFDTDDYNTITKTMPNTYNKTFGFCRHINISMANTTQILDTAKPLDLYRICKANGLQDSIRSFSCAVQKDDKLPSYYADHDLPDIPVSKDQPSGQYFVRIADTNHHIDNRAIAFCRAGNDWNCPGVGSVLRLIPGTDIVIPDQPLIPGANANNLVLQVEGDFEMPSVPPEYENKFALWILFEYVGVATITPGQCQITMNPLGNGSVMKAAPVVSEPEQPSTVEGSGWLDKIKEAASALWNHGGFKDVVKDNQLVSKLAQGIAGYIPGVNLVSPLIGTAVHQLTGMGETGKKRPRLSGGAQMGLGDFC